MEKLPMGINSKLDWLKRNWFWIAAIFSFVGWILLKGPEALSNAEKLPAAFSSASDKFLSWYYKDDEWTGVWSSKAEGYVDMADIPVSTVDVHIEMDVHKGRVDGTIATKKICETFPMWDFVLLEGQISGDEFDGIVWDVIKGERQNFALVNFQKKGDVLKVTPKEGYVSWFPAEAVIMRHPGESPMQTESVDKSYCYEEKMAFARLLEGKKKLVEPEAINK